MSDIRFGKINIRTEPIALGISIALFLTKISVMLYFIISEEAVLRGKRTLRISVAKSENAQRSTKSPSKSNCLESAVICPKSIGNTIAISLVSCAKIKYVMKAERFLYAVLH